MRWDTILLIAVISIFSVMDAENRKADRKEVSDLTTRVEALERRPGHIIRLAPGPDNKNVKPPRKLPRL